MKNKKAVITSAALFSGGFIAALSLLFFTNGSLPTTDMQGSLLVYNPQNGAVSEMPVYFQKPPEDSQGSMGGRRPFLDHFWKGGGMGNSNGGWSDTSTGDDSEFTKDFKGGGFFPGFSQGNSDPSYNSDEGDDTSSDDGSSEEDSQDNSAEIESLKSQIEEITVKEKELIGLLQGQLPGSSEYKELGTELKDLRDQKLKLFQELKSLDPNGLKWGNGNERGMMQKFGNRAEEMQKILETCKSDPEGFGNCMARKMGKQNMRGQYGDTDQFETMPKWGNSQGGFPGMDNGSGGFQDGQTQNGNTGRRSSFKDIIDGCRQDPTTMKECIKAGMEAEKQRILEEVRQRLEEMQKAMEGINMGDEPTYTPPPPANDSESTDSSTTVEESNVNNCSVSCTNGVCTYKGECSKRGPVFQGGSVNMPYSNGGPKTPDEWRKYNEQYNSKPTI